MKLSALNGAVAPLLQFCNSIVPFELYTDPSISGVANSEAFTVVASSDSKVGEKSGSIKPRTPGAAVKPAPPRPASNVLTFIKDAVGSIAGLRVDALGLELSRSVCHDGQQAFAIKRFTPNVATNAGILGSATRTCETPTAATQITAATPPITVTQTMFQSLPLKQRRTKCNCGQDKEQLP